MYEEKGEKVNDWIKHFSIGKKTLQRPAQRDKEL